MRRECRAGASEDAGGVGWLLGSGPAVMSEADDARGGVMIGDAVTVAGGGPAGASAGHEASGSLGGSLSAEFSAAS